MNKEQEHENFAALAPDSAGQSRRNLVNGRLMLSPDDVAELVQRLDGWNFRQIARFAEEVVRRYVSNLDLSLLEAGGPAPAA